jgi:hypothetical protein
MMVALIFLFVNLVSLFRSKSRLEAENAALLHQLTVLVRKVRGRVPFTNDDRLGRSTRFSASSRRRDLKQSHRRRK